MFRYDVYLAGPFFNETQKATMKAAREQLEAAGLKVCDPQELSPVITDLPPEERKEQLFAGIFANNILGMEQSQFLVACIDDRDTGTAFEIGYFYGKPGPSNQNELLAIYQSDHGGIFTFSAHGYGANVMLAQATDGHVSSLEDFGQIVQAVKTGKPFAGKPVSNE